MAQLDNFEWASESVMTSGGVLAVRGLSTEDLLSLMGRHRPTMDVLFMQAMSAVQTKDTEALVPLIGAVVDSAPSFVVDVIALALSAPDEHKAILRRAPISDQIVLLDAAVRQTFAAEGSAKKVMEIVVRLLKTPNLLAPAV